MIFFLITAPMYLGLALFLFVRSLRGRAVRKAISDHDEYERERVYERNRPSFHGDHRETAIHQRAQRILHKYKIPITLEQVRKILEK